MRVPITEEEVKVPLNVLDQPSCLDACDSFQTFEGAEANYAETEFIFAVLFTLTYEQTAPFERVAAKRFVFKSAFASCHKCADSFTCVRGKWFDSVGPKQL